MIDALLERWLTAVGTFVHRRAAWVVAVGLLSLVPAGVLAMRLEVRSSFLDLLPPDDPPVVQLEAVLDHARSTSDVIVAISTADRDAAERFASALADALDADPEVAGIGGRIHREWLEGHQMLFVPEDELERLVVRAEAVIDHEVMVRSGFDLGLDEPGEIESPDDLLAELEESATERLGASEWVETRDQRYLVLWAYFAGNAGDIEFGAQAWDRVREHLARIRAEDPAFDAIEIHYAGGIPSRVEDEQALVADLRLAGAVGFFAVVLLIVVALRTPRALILLAVPLFVGLVWTFAFARVSVGHLNIISGFLFSILSGLGIEYGIHLIHRYRELREEGWALEAAIQRLVSTTGRALLTGSMTNAGVFAVIAFSNFHGFSEFGLIAAVGLILTLVATLLGLPALIVLGERIRPLKLPEQREDQRPLVVPAPLRWAIVVGLPVAAACSGALLYSGALTFDGNWRSLVSDTDTSRYGEYLRRQLSDFTQALLWVEDIDDLPRVEATLEEIRAERAERGLPFDVIDVVTLTDVFPTPEAQARRAALARRLRAQLDRIRPGTLDAEGERRLEEGRATIDRATPFTIEEMPYSLVGHLMTRDGLGSIVHLRAPQTDDTSTEHLIAWSEEARLITDRLEADGLEAPMLSENWVAGEIFRRIRDDAGFLTFATLAAVLVVLLLDLRRPLIAVSVLGSVLLGIVVMLGLLWVFGLRLNFMNIAILPVCVSISLDNAIHVLHRWQQGGRGSIADVLRHTTRANALASATNLLGFAALVLAQHQGLRSVAYLATIGVAATYFSTTIWFPMVLDTIDRLGLRRDADKDAAASPTAT